MQYINPDYIKTFKRYNLNTFSDIWDLKIDWFEEINKRRGGWSGVCKITLDGDGVQRGIFLKRQQNHQSKSLMHPFKGMPTFASEFKMLVYLAKNDVPSLKVVAFDVKHTSHGDQAILMTQELVDFDSLENITERIYASVSSLSEKNLIIKQVAHTVAKLHKSRVQHRSLYPKHLFVDKKLNKDVVVIDLEKSRIKWIRLKCTLHDLSTLNRHAKYWTKTRRLYFYLQYLGIPRLTPFTKWLCRMIIKRSNR